MSNWSLLGKLGRTATRLTRALGGNLTEAKDYRRVEVPSMEARYDRFRSEPPRLKYVVCALPRTGSTLLCHGLWTSGLGGKPAEYFNPSYCLGLLQRWGSLPRRWRVVQALLHERMSVLPFSRVALDRYLSDMMRYRTGDNGVFGFKIHPAQYAGHIAPLPLSELLPDARFIYLRRRDHIRQSVSRLRAIQSRRYRSSSDGIADTPRYDFQRLRAFHRVTLAQERFWQAQFERESIDPLIIEYEQLAQGYAATTMAVLRHIGVELPEGFEPPAPQMKRQSDHISDAWVARFQEDLAALPAG